jgi:pyridoxamine 5'-phosphate oxidase
MNQIPANGESRQLALDESGADADPFVQFGCWYQAAAALPIDLPNAMVLATADARGMPSARYVLMKGWDLRGIVFYTHSTSAKGRQLAANANAALVFYWPVLHRQVRVEGAVEYVADAEADAYFASRPYPSRVSVWVAEQSTVVPDRAYLDRRHRELDARYGGGAVPRPDTWHGYRVVPRCFEFWQGRDNRLHDRLRYERLPSGEWQRQRLAP